MRWTYQYGYIVFFDKDLNFYVETIIEINLIYELLLEEPSNLNYKKRLLNLLAEKKLVEGLFY